MSSLVLPCLGMAPDQHALAAPPGSMRYAENVVCDLPGIVRARPSFELGTQKTSAYYPLAMHVAQYKTRFAVTYNGSAYRLESETATITGNADPVNFDERETCFAEARGSIYYCTSTGVRALRTEQDVATEAAGLERPMIAPDRSSTNFTPHATLVGPHTGPYSAAYCAVVKRTDAGDYTKRSPPTQRWMVAYSGAAALKAIILGSTAPGNRWLIRTGDVLAGDEVEIYRTRMGSTADAAVPADMYLVVSYTVTTADVSAGYLFNNVAALYDTVDDDGLGEALYTNPQREGALAAKMPPVICEEIAPWAKCMWFGKTKDRQRLELSLLNSAATVYPAGADDPVNDTAFSVRETIGDTAIGSPNILNVVNVTGVVVGQAISTSGQNPYVVSNFPAGTTVVSISGAGPYTVVASQNATAAVVGGYIYFSDVFWVGTYPIAASFVSGITATGAAINVNTGGALPSFRTERSAAALAAMIDTACASGYIAVRASAFENSIILENVALSASAFTVAVTKPQAFSPRIGDDLVDTITSSRDVRRNRLYFSLPDEPEAVPLLSYIDLGSEKGAIQRLIPLADALLVFKEDGLYRITGSAPDRWSVSLLDPTLCLVRPEACAALDDTVYAWSNRGVVKVDETGVRAVISAGKIDTRLFTAQGAILGDDEYHGCRILTSQRHQLVLLTVPNTAVESTGIYYSDTVYCYSVKTGLWTEWPDLYIRCGDTSSDGVLWVAVTNSLAQLEWETRYLRDTARGYDRSYTVGAGSGAPSAWTQTASSTAMSITNAQRNEWVPTVGDWVFWTIGSVYWRRIIAVSDDGGGDYSWTLDSAAPSNIASATDKGAVVGAPVLLEWLPSSAGNGGMTLPVWRGLTFTMDGEAAAKVSPTDFRVTLGVRHDGSATVATVTGTPDRSTVQIRPYRMGWPRNGSRRPDVGPRLSWSEIDWPWRLSGIALIGEDGSERVRT